MDRRSAEILSKGKAEIRAIGEPCDPSCAMWFCCENSVPNGICKGFVLLNGESRKLLRRNMQEDDLLYLEDCVGAVQNGCAPDVKRSLTGEVFRCLKPISDILEEEPIERLGFRGMLDHVSKETDTPSPSQPIIRGFGRGFRGMLDEMSEGKKRSIAGVMPQAGIDECNFDCNYHQYCTHFENLALCKGFKLVGTADVFGHENLTTTPKPSVRGFSDGFIGMLEDASRGTTPEIRRTNVVRNINYGFKAMAESACGETSAITTKPIHREISVGFRGMLDDFTRRTEEEEAKNLQKVVPIFRFQENAKVNCGFKAMVDDAFSHENPIRLSRDPILRGLQRNLRAILNVR